jgi:sporulation protein YabP
MPNLIENSTLNLESRKRLNVTGVNSVDGFTDQFVNLTVLDSKLKIIGENLKIINFNKSNGSFLLEGLINEIKYAKKRKPLIKRLLK